MRIGLKAAQWRKQRGFSQQQAADALSINIVKYRTLEEDINAFTPELLVGLADFLDVSVDSLLGREVSQSQTKTAQPLDLKDVLKNHAVYEGWKLSAGDADVLASLAEKLTQRARQLETLLQWAKDDPDWIKRLQELKLVPSRLSQQDFIDTLQKALA